MRIRIISKKYLKTTSETELKVEIFYSLGGWNFGTGNNDPRGYWLSVQPVSRSDNHEICLESVVLGSGMKTFLAETKVDRKGGKAELAAIESAKQQEANLVEKVCLKEKLTLAA